MSSLLLKSAVGALVCASGAFAQGKRGLNYNNATWANYFTGYPQITWGYNWGWPSNGLDASFEFVPMLWGVPSAADPDWTTAAEGAKNILTFNEPDLNSQANTIPSVAAAGYQTYVQPLQGKVRISAPAVTNAGEGVLAYIGLGWLSSFYQDCTGCHYDFQAIHCEGPGNVGAKCAGADCCQGTTMPPLRSSRTI